MVNKFYHSARKAPVIPHNPDEFYFNINNLHHRNRQTIREEYVTVKRQTRIQDSIPRPLTQ